MNRLQSILIAMLFPLTMSHYWFASYYVVLLLLAPALNFFVHRVTQRRDFAYEYFCITEGERCRQEPEGYQQSH